MWLNFILKAAQITEINKSSIDPKRYAFPGEEISAIKHNICNLFTKFTFLFTILIPQVERYQSRFVEINFDRYEK
jgi:hypothetical protein